MSYFSRNNTAGAFASDGFRYQDQCAVLLTVENLLSRDFLSVGIETEDDFCLLFGNRRINAQVKDSELTFALIKTHLDQNRLLIGSSIKKDVESFAKYLAQFKNSLESAETVEKKREIAADFALVRQRHGLPEIPPSWTLHHRPRAGLYECIAYNIDAVAKTKLQVVDINACISHLLTLFANARSTRSYFTKQQLLEVISGFGADVQIVESRYFTFEIPMAQNVIKSMGGSAPALLEKFAEKIRHAETLHKSGHFKDALTIYASLSVFLETEEIFLACAMLHDMLDDLPAARKSARRALICNARCFGAHFILSTLACEQGDNSEGLNHFEAAYAINPSDPALLYNLGVYWQKVDLPKAIGFYQRSLALDNDNSSAHLNCGISLFLNGEPVEALQHIDQALLLEPGAPAALSQKGEIQRFLGNYLEAIELFERALRKDSENTISLAGIAYCHLALGEESGVGMLIDHFEPELLELQVGQSLSITTPGGNKTNRITFERRTQGQLKFHYNDLSMMVLWPNTDSVILGTLAGPKKNLIPVIAKTYGSREGYHRALQLIAHGDDGGIELTDGKISERRDWCHISLKINAFNMSGKTPRTNGGYESFRENYHGQFLLILCNLQDDTEIQLRLQGIEFS